MKAKKGSGVTAEADGNDQRRWLLPNIFARYPVGCSLLAATIYFMILAWPALGSGTAFGHNSQMQPNVAPTNQRLEELWLALSALVLVVLVGWGKSARVFSRPLLGGSLVALFPAAIIALILSVGVSRAFANPEAFQILWSTGLLQGFALLAICVGIFEEVLFRGIVLHGFERRFGPVTAVLASSVLFGAMHYVNWVNGQSFGGTTQQVIHAGLSGLLYGALTLRANSAWPAVVIHALWDFTVIFNTSILGAFPESGDTTAVALSGGTGIAAFLLKYFEPILGVIILASWYFWHRRRGAEPVT